MIYRDFDFGRRQTSFDVPTSRIGSGKYFTSSETSSGKSLTSRFEQSLAMSTSRVVSSYPLSKSYTEAFRPNIESRSRYESRYEPTKTTTTTSTYSTRYNSPVSLTARYSSPAPLTNSSYTRSILPLSDPIRYTSPARSSSLIRTEASMMTTPSRFLSSSSSSLKPSPSSLSSTSYTRRLNEMRPPPAKPRELPPTPPKPIRRHYPIPPPSFPDAMIAVSKRLRNRSASPAPRYSDLQISRRPSLVNVALGRETPSRESIRRSLAGSAASSYVYSSSRHL